MRRTPHRWQPPIRLLCALLALSWLVETPALVVDQEAPDLPERLRVALTGLDHSRYRVLPQAVPADAAMERSARWTTFKSRFPGERTLRVDGRTGTPLLIEGEGIPLVPGGGNRLTRAAFGTQRSGDTATLIAGAGEAFITQNRRLFEVTPEDLVWDEKRSAGFGGGRYWSLRYQHVVRDPDLGPIPVRDAHVFLRVSQGNVIQMGNHQVVRPRRLDTRGTVSADRVRGTILGYFDDPSTVTLEPVAPDFGQRERSLEIVPRNAADGSLEHQLVHSYSVHTPELDLELWYDAQSGELVYVRNRRFTIDGVVRGGIYPVTNTDTEVLRGLPFLTVVNDGVSKTTDGAGVYDYTPAGSLATATLDGDFVSINDNCGAASLATSTSPGDINFGLSTGTDCATPGFGGPGNTHAARSTYYHLNQIKEKARSYLNVPMVTTPWLEADLTANVNINSTCNAFWNGSTVNFYRSGGGCSNTGELAAVFLHEFGHGLDENTNGLPPENGSGEAYSDILAFLQTHDSCIGHNFRPGVPCLFGCDATCTGVRDVAVTPAVSPTTIEMAPANCDAFACPFLVSGVFPYQGPMGYQGHCESLIASGAVWDMVQGFVARYGDGAGWALADRIWYESLYQTESAYQLNAGAMQCDPTASVDGCGATNWYTVFLALDDDNGNLADGTPNADIIWNAFNDHGIACGAAAPPVNSTCPTLAAPAPVVVPMTGQVDLSWPAVTSAASYRIFRNELGCDQGFTPIDEVAAPTTSLSDTAVANGTDYFYAVQAVGTNPLCVSAFSPCLSATPTEPLDPTDIFMVLDASGSMGGTTDVAGESKMDALHDAALMVVDLVSDYADDGFRIGGVSFASSVTGTETLKDLSVPAERTALEGFITGLTPGGATAIGQGINQALASFPAASPNRRDILLLSDGMQNISPNLELATPPPGAEVGGTPLPTDVRFSTVALGTNIEEDLFDDLANLGGIAGFYYGGGTADIQTNFGYWVADALGLDADPPFENTGPTTDFVVNRSARRITFLVTWQAKGTRLRFHLETPVGRIDPPRTNFHPERGYAAYTVRLPLGDHRPEDHLGTWTLHVTDFQGNAATTPTRSFAFFDDPLLDLHYEAGGNDPGAGEPLPLTVRVEENGQPVSGLTARVRVMGPGEGTGELLSRSTVQPARATVDRFPTPAAGKLATLVTSSPELFTEVEAGFLTLTETTPGTYTTTLGANRTVASGTYDITFEVAGEGNINGRFVRSQHFSRHLRVKPRPQATDVVAERIRGGDLQVVRVIFTPRDANRKRLGPGWAGHIVVTSSSGTPGKVVDRLDGSYTVDLPAAGDPQVEIQVRGEPVASGPVSGWLGGSGGGKLTLGAFVGYSSLDSALPVDDGPLLGSRLGLRRGPHWSFETEFAATFTDDTFGDAGVIFQLSQSVLYRLQPGPRPVETFLTGGLGAVFFTGFANDDSALTFHLGAGVAIDLVPGWDLRLDLRQLWIDDAYGTGTTGNLQATVGLEVLLP